MMRWDVKTLGIAIAVIVVLAAAGLFVARSGTPAFGQSMTIGYVDMARALDAHPGRASAESALRDYARAQVADAQQKMKTMSATQKQDLQRQVDQAIFKKRSELLGGLDKDIRAAVDKVAKQQGVNVVLTRDVVLYGGVDLTDQVIKVVSGK
ncbi:MAG TPA: OmpH family outer membrane protein [bacterium]|nr:OmpH family outer membrane protein [bacterium]